MIFSDCNFLDFIGVRDNPFKQPLILSEIYDKLDEFKGNLKGLQNFFKKWRVSIADDLDKSNVKAFVSGWTLTPYLNGKDYVNIKLYIHTRNGFDNHTFTNSHWIDFKILFVQVLAHEFIHFRQAHNTKNLEFKDNSLNYKKSEKDSVECERGYHACVQEIEAYGHCLYLETLYNPCKYKDFKKRLVRTPTYIMLLNVYSGNHTCDVIKAHKGSAIKWKLKYEKKLKHESW